MGQSKAKQGRAEQGMDSEGREGIGREGPDFLRECLALPEGGRNYWKLLVNLGEASQDPLPASLLSPSLTHSLSPPSLTVSTFLRIHRSLPPSRLPHSLYLPYFLSHSLLSHSLKLLHCLLKCVFSCTSPSLCISHSLLHPFCLFFTVLFTEVNLLTVSSSLSVSCTTLCWIIITYLSYHNIC